MELTAFDPDSSTNGMPKADRGLPEIHASKSMDRVQAVIDLTQNKFLTHTYGVQEEWEVKTTFVTSRQAWRYRSSVLVHGKEIGEVFSPIEVDRTRHMRRAAVVSEEMLVAFAREAVEVHCSRCASVEEYSLLASIYSQPLPRRHRSGKVALSLLCVAALLTLYWFWTGSNRVGLEQLYGYPQPESVLWQPSQVFYRYPAGEPFVFPLPTLKRTPEAIPVEVMIEAAGGELPWLALDDGQLNIHGTAPLTTEDQTYHLIIRAHASQGSDSRLLVLLTITGQPQPIAPTPPQLRGHWTW